MCSNKENSGKDIHWIIIDDNESVLENISDELTDSGINRNFIHCFTPGKQVKFNPKLQSNNELWLDFNGDTYDWDYEINPSLIKGWRKTLFELIKDIENKISNIKKLYFVFILDILYQDDCNFCGFDLYRAIRWHINPEHYIVRFLSHLSRSLIEEFIDNEYPNLKLGREVKKRISKNEISKKGTRLKANNYYRIDLGFYSKAGYRKDISRSSNVDDIKINIINHDIIDNIKETFPRDISYNDIFWLYNNIYPVLKVCEDSENSKTDKNNKKEEEDISYVVIDGEKRIDISSVKYNKNYITRESIFKSRYKFLELCYNLIQEDKKSDIIENIGIFNQTNNSFKFNITGEDTDKKMSKGLHFECEWMGKEYTLKSPLYRQEVLRLYNLLNDPEKKVIDILFIGDKVDVKLANSIVNDELVDNVNDIKDLQTIVGKTRPKYIIVNQADDNNNTILKTIKEVILSIPNFEIHGFGVYFIANYWQDKGIPQSCLLNIKDDNTICIESPISPVFWKLIFMLAVEYPLDTIIHDLFNKNNYTVEEWEKAKQRAVNLLSLKKDDKKYQSISDIIGGSIYDGNMKWSVGNQIYNYRNFLIKLGINSKQEGNVEHIHWILITDNDKLKNTIQKELEKLAENFAISNNLKYTDEDFTCWMFSDIDEIDKIEKKVDELKQINNSQFVFMFDSKAPILQYIKEENKEILQTAIQYIAERMKRESITFRIFFTYNSQSEREEFYSERKYLQIEEYKAIDELNNIENRLVKRIKEEQKDLLKGITEEQKILVKGIKDELDKRMKDVVSAKQLFLFYPSEMKEDKIEIIGPDVLYFIRKDLKNCYSLNKELWGIFEQKDDHKEFLKHIEDQLEKFYKEIKFTFNKDKYETNNINCQCNWTGYALKEQDNINFFKDRIRLISKYIVLKLNRENYKKLYDDPIFDEMKRYKLSCYKGNIRWNNLFEHEKKFIICRIICVIINKEKKKIEDEKNRGRKKTNTGIIKIVFDEYFYLKKDDCNEILKGISLLNLVPSFFW